MIKVENQRKFSQTFQILASKDIIHLGNAQHTTCNAGDTVTGMGAGTGNGNEKFEIIWRYCIRWSMNVSFQLRVNQRQSLMVITHNLMIMTTTQIQLIGHSPLVGGVMRLHGMGIQEATADGSVKN